MAKDTRALTATVAEGEDKLRLLEQVANEEGLWQLLDATARRRNLARHELPILIKPDFGYFDFKGSTGTDPELVEHLVDLLCDRGYSSVTVGSARDSTMRWLENRDPLTLADAAGYRFVTELGRPYSILDLSEDLEEVTWPEASILEGTAAQKGLSRHWIRAAVRISFAKNKTDAAQGYALTLHNLLGVFPEPEKEHYYGRRWPAEEVCLDLLRTYPPHFCLIDAWVSNHGSAGSRKFEPLETRTLIASQQTLLADWVGALKMDIDPYASRLMTRAIEILSLPTGHKIRGDLTPYPGWVNVPPILRQAVQQRVNWAPGYRVDAPWTQSVNRELFPFKDEVDDGINRFLSSAAGPDANPLAMSAAVWANYAMAAVGQAINAWEVLYDKSRLERKERSLGIDLSQFAESDYEAVAPYLKPFEEEISGVPVDEFGLAWRYVGKSVLFRFARTIPIPFDEFVARVDIAQAIGYMNDYVGGKRIPVKWDEQARVIHQAERNIYLPQPNYLVLSGGVEIDVTKIELITYSSNAHKILWRTVKSENGSALHDDGSVTFDRRGAGATHITVSGLQQFTLPLFWQILDLDRFPPAKDHLVTQAYRTFFLRTMSNFEAAWEGRDFRVGKPWNPPSSEAGAIPSELRRKALAKLDQAAKATKDVLVQIIDAVPLVVRPHGSVAGELDEQGFRHFSDMQEEIKGHELGGRLKRAVRQISEIITDLGKEVAKDFGMRGGE